MGRQASLYYTNTHTLGVKKIREYSHLEPIAMALFYVLENLWQQIAGWKKTRRDSKKYAASIYVLPFKQKKEVWVIVWSFIYYREYETHLIKN